MSAGCHGLDVLARVVWAREALELGDLVTVEVLLIDLETELAAAADTAEAAS